MPSPVEETIPLGMQSLSDAVARAVKVSERSVVTSVEQETTSEHELVLKANTAEESDKKPATGASSTEPVDTTTDVTQATAPSTAATKQTLVTSEANVTEKSVDRTVVGLSSTVSAITTEVTPPAHAGEMGITAPPTPSTGNPKTKVTAVETEVPPYQL